MCPLRIILIFLSATLAGFFVLRNIKSQSHHDSTADDSAAVENKSSNNNKVYGAFVKGFWTFVDMASGRYLWRNLVSVSKKAD